MALQKLLGALPLLRKQAQHLPLALTATAGLAGTRALPSGAAAAAAAARSFSSSAAASSSMSSLHAAAAGLRQLAQCSGNGAMAACSMLRFGASPPAAAAAAAAAPRAAAQLQLRPRTTSSHLVPKFAGAKIKPYSSYKNRFKLTGTGKVMFPRAGHVHKRHNKSKSQLFKLAGKAVMHSKYAKTVKKIGFRMRTF